MSLVRLPVMVAILMLTHGCGTSVPQQSATAPAPTAISMQDVELERASVLVAEPLNISILLLGLSSSGEAVSRMYKPIRNAEAAYLPVLLRNTLNESGYWGAVSVVPSLDTASEVFISGEIVESNALELSIRFQVEDSRGEVWIDRIYTDFASPSSYETDVELAEDPFQDLFDQLANDMSKVHKGLGSEQRMSILDTAMLKYAVLLSPEAFASYLKENESGQINLLGLPARNDPLYQRVRKIRDREFSIQDVIDDHFENFYTDMHEVYPYWRQSSYELVAYNAELESRSAGGSKGSWPEVERVYRLYKERKLNEDELRELANSFEREIDPTVAKLEGRVIELQGSLLTQYQSWRRILRQIYAEMVGDIPPVLTRQNPAYDLE